LRPRTSASSSTMAPRAALMMMTPFFIGRCWCRSPGPWFPG
jgi:hypothetical protein